MISEQLDPITKSAVGAEGGALGSMILDRNCVDVVRGIVGYDDFGRAEHKVICQAIYELANDPSGDIDLVRIKEWLDTNGLLDAAGGAEYVVSVVETLPTSGNAEYYARIVKEHSIRRQISRIANDVTKQCLLPEGKPAEQIRLDAVKMLSDCVDSYSSPFETMAQVFDGFSFEGNDTYFSTGFPSVDRSIIGYGGGQVIIVAGRPGTGKSSFMSTSAYEVARKGKNVLFFSMEMSAMDIALRIACSITDINLQYAIKGTWIGEEQKANMKKAINTIKKLPIMFDCKSLTTSRLRSTVASLSRQKKIDIVFVDYLGLIRGSSSKQVSKYESVSEISGVLKEIALDSGLPIVVGCQLNRSNEYRTDKRPMLADLRDSGSIEQDADIVFLLHRPSMYPKPDSQDEIDTELCECNVAKNRRGQTGIIELGFRPYCTRFYCRSNIPEY